ncbi:MAG: hypothetical protein KIT27_06815 [Legionellales bacterium]|nr:hypothetical protein [Legionellales bacterium]
MPTAISKFVFSSLFLSSLALGAPQHYLCFLNPSATGSGSIKLAVAQNEYAAQSTSKVLSLTAYEAPTFSQDDSLECHVAGQSHLQIIGTTLPTQPQCVLKDNGDYAYFTPSEREHSLILLAVDGDSDSYNFTLQNAYCLPQFA